MTEQRADAKFSMPDGSYPINNCADVSDAAKLAHHSKTYSFAQVKAHVMKAKNALNCPDSVLPATWGDGGRAMGDEIERRYTPAVVQVRATRDRIGGYAAMFNSSSRNLGGFVEQVRSTAFSRAGGRGFPDVVARFNHDDNMLLGTTAAGTLRLALDDTGLAYDVKPPQSRADIIELVERGDVRHSSFAFRAIEEDWSTTDQGFPQRSLVNVELVDVAPVVNPAYPSTSAALRSLATYLDVELAEVERRAAQNELRSFFVRTDVEGQSKKRTLTFGASARLALLAREHDPWT